MERNTFRSEKSRTKTVSWPEERGFFCKILPTHKSTFGLFPRQICSHVPKHKMSCVCMSKIGSNRGTTISCHEAPNAPLNSNTKLIIGRHYTRLSRSPLTLKGSSKMARPHIVALTASLQVQQKCTRIEFSFQASDTRRWQKWAHLVSQIKCLIC